MEKYAYNFKRERIVSYSTQGLRKTNMDQGKAVGKKNA